MWGQTINKNTIADKKESHTGFRNEDLFCFNCGQSYHVEMPQPMDMYQAILKQFEKSHKNCKKTWTEPIAETNGKSERQNAIWWLSNGEHGLSSKTMFNALCQDANMRIRFGVKQYHPSDPDDFSRCYKLLEAVPQWKSRLNELKTISPVWERLVDNWDKLTEMYEKNEGTEWKNSKEIGMYEFMESLGC